MNARDFACPVTSDPDSPHDRTIKHGGCWCKPCRSAYARAYRHWRDPESAERAAAKEQAKGASLIYAKRPWTCEEDQLLGTDRDRAIGLLIDRNDKAVAKRRQKLGIAPCRKWGRRLKAGYIEVVLASGDPYFEMARSNGTVFEHRLVMAEHLGRPLTLDESVHHRNGIKTDNRLENLELWTRSHPDGQRVQDVFEWCVEFVERYAREQG